MLLYKYKSLATKESKDYSLESLKKKYLYFSRPSELNDPFDCRIQPDFSATDKEYLQWIKSNKKKMIPGNKLSTVDGIKKAIKEPKFIEGFKRTAIDLVEVNHILSLTPDCYNESMWGLYAGNYNGICIGYSIPETDLAFLPQKIHFTSKDTNDVFSQVNQPISFEEVSYDNNGDKPLQIFRSYSEQVKSVAYNLTHKKKCWINEHEYRAIIHDTDFYNTMGNDFSTKVFDEDKLLEEIIFGFNVSIKMVYRIKKIIKDNYSSCVKFFRLEADFKQYALVKVEI